MINKLLSRLGYEKRGKRLRAWDSAKSSRLMDGWLTAPQPVNREIRGALSALRARSRDQAQNNDYMQRFLQLVQTNVVGHNGIVLQAKAKDADGTLDKLANDAIEAAWHDWGRLGSCDETGRFSWKSLQRQFVRSVAMDGEAFIYLNRNSKMNQYQFSVRMLDPSMVDVNLNVNQANKRIDMGVELNSVGRPIAIYVNDSAGTDYSYQGRKYTRIDVDNILHCYLPEWVDGARGIPWVSQSLLRMGMLNGYEEAELVAARVSSAKMGFFTSEDGGQYLGDAKDAEGNIVMDAEPGLFEQLPSGVSYQAHDPQHPTTAYAEFIKSSMRGIAAGLGVSYNSLANDLEGVNYSSLRQGAIEERAVWMMLQDWMVEVFNERIYRVWLSNSLDTGAISIMGRPINNTRFEKFSNVSWQPRRWQWVDPAKEMSANREAIDMGIRSRSDIIREMGRDPEDVWQEIAAEQERMQELGITTETASAGSLMGEENTDKELSDAGFDIDELKKSADAYGVGVRAGTLTPQPEDEAQYRTKAGLPEMSAAVNKAWESDGGVRRPITLQGGDAFNASQDEIEGNEESDED